HAEGPDGRAQADPGACTPQHRQAHRPGRGAQGHGVAPFARLPRAYRSTTSRSFASTACPARVSTSATSPATSARTAVCIFIASRVSRVSPRDTLAPAVVLTVATTPGIGAPTWRRLPASILRGG